MLHIVSCTYLPTTAALLLKLKLNFFFHFGYVTQVVASRISTECLKVFCIRLTTGFEYADKKNKKKSLFNRVE